ncbi:unnamed protein product [Rotaria sordida]|uniref:Methyltransferase type 11 domain-containing protein n=2 Tax=Rotaria sordida TaxID=392033 RepID=A0A818RS81_9BILA|nr:unnamed protein product [Rotaria sordida]
MEVAVVENEPRLPINTYEHDWIHIIYMITSTICFVIAVYQRISIDFFYASYTNTYVHVPSLNQYPTDLTASSTSISYIWYLVFIWQAMWIIYSFICIFRRTSFGYYFYQYPCAMNRWCFFYTASALLLYIPQLAAGANNTYDVSISIFRYIGTLVNVFIVVVIVHNALQDNMRDYFRDKYFLDVWLTRLLYQNGLAIWASILFYESCLSITIGLIYSNNDYSTASNIGGFILLIGLIMIFFFENCGFNNSIAFILSHWFIFLWLLIDINFLSNNKLSESFCAIILLPTIEFLIFIYIVMDDLSKQSYWNKRFLIEDSYEWFGDCLRLYPILDLYLKSSPSFILLHLGCGSSSLAEEMYNRHYCHLILNIDYSFCILDKRRSIKKNECLIDWFALDIRAMPLRSEYFDTIIEKGTLDVFFVGHEHCLWNPSEELKEKIDLILTQISQCLRSDSGRFISISFQQPHFRRPFLAKQKYQWSIQVHSISDGNESMEYFVYVMTKGEQMNEEDRLLEEGKSTKWTWINKQESLRQITTYYIDEQDDQYLLNINIEDNE